MIKRIVRKLSGGKLSAPVLILFLYFSLSGKAISEATIGGNFSLTDHHGQLFNLDQLRGNYVLIYFGYLGCPDICPIELNTIAQTMRQLDDLQITGLFITLDPENDSPEYIRQYVQYFHPDILGLTGTQDEIRKIATQYRIRYKTTIKNDVRLIDHSVQIVIVDKHGELKAITPFGTPSDQIVRTIQGLEQQSG